MKKEDVRKIVGVLLIAVGIVILLHGFGYIQFAVRKPLVTVPSGTVGMEITSTAKSFSLPLATVAPGAEYKWSITLRNTGTVNWDTFSTNLRIAKAYAQRSDCSLCQSPCTSCGYTCQNFIEGYKTYYADKCDSKCDYIECRESLSGWKIYYSFDGSTWTDATPVLQDSGTILRYTGTNLNSGSSFTWYFKITAPSSGNYYAIVNAIALIGSENKYIIDSKVDTISVGTVSGELVLTFIGALSLIAGLGFALWGFKPW